MARKSRRREALRVENLEGRLLLSVADLAPAPVLPGPGANLLVRFADGTPTAQDQSLIGSVHGRLVRSYPDGPSLVTLTPGTNTSVVLAQLRANAGVRYAEADGKIHVNDVFPNDPSFPRQWGLSSINDIDINAPQAWQVTTGNPSTIVAVIDSGLDINSPEFAGRLWTNPGEIGGNGLDDDHDGYVDDVHGWDFLDNSPNLSDAETHGTHVTGILAATGNNGIGVAGVNWAARIMPLKFIGADGNGDVDAAVQAIYYAVLHGARVINASWGGNEYSQSLVDAISFANAHNVVFVTSAGNESVDNDFIPTYPANIRLPNVISVAAVDAFGNLADFSNYGPATVSVAAPGVDIRSTVPGGYATYSGTSMASPFVAGVVSLMVGLRPDLSAAQLVQRVLSTVKPLPSLYGKLTAPGIVDGVHALASILPVGATGSTSVATLSDDDARSVVLGSDEYFAAHGGTLAGFVNGLYSDVLGRTASPGEVIFWAAQVQPGRKRNDVARSLLAAPEAQLTKVARWFITYQGWTTPLAVLKTNPMVIHGASFLLHGGSDNDLLATILASDAYLVRRGGTTAGFLDGLYRDLLGRPIDAAGLVQWGGLLASGRSRADVARAILGTAEANRTRVARWFLGDLRRTTPLQTLKSDPFVVGLAQLIAP